MYTVELTKLDAQFLYSLCMMTGGAPEAGNPRHMMDKIRNQLKTQGVDKLPHKRVYVRGVQAIGEPLSPNVHPYLYKEP